jgi:hypothetical protein
MPHPDILVALDMLEHCRFAYKSYAQACTYPMDPFYESHGGGVWQGARDRVMAEVHKRAGTSELVAKFDPVQYNLDETPHPRRGVVYRSGTGDDPYILFQPRPLDLAIGFAKGVDIAGNDIKPADLEDSAGTKRCCHFQGMTGMTKESPGSGWRSWLGAVIYDAREQSIVVVFRGSRSGSGTRALAQALTQSKGSPDWVTDMEHLKGFDVPRFGNATFVVGFWLAYASCKASLEAAFYEALWNRQIKSIYFTGHSLGGALAQCAYLDFVAGDLLSKSGAMKAIKKDVPINCYAISSPPIVLGDASLERVRSAVPFMAVHHYFAENDSVHDSPEVSTSGSSALNATMGFFAHPLTSTRHIGVEYRLASDASFPDAHEPEVVRKAMVAEVSRIKQMGLGPDRGFWPLLDLDVTRADAPRMSCGFEQAARDALALSSSADLTEKMAWLWADVRLGSGAEKGNYLSLDSGAGEQFDIFLDVQKALARLGNPFVDDRAATTKTLMKLRAQLLTIYDKPADHKATSASVYVMLQHIAAFYLSTLR